MPAKFVLGIVTSSLALLFLLVVSLSGGNGVSAQEVPNPTNTNTPVPTSTSVPPTATSTSTPVGTATPVPAATPIPGVPARIQLTVTPIVCGGGNITAFVTDGFGNPVPNGTSVFFSSNLGTIGGTFTSGGFATGTLAVAPGVVGPAAVFVTAGNSNATVLVPFTPCFVAQPPAVIVPPTQVIPPAQPAIQPTPFPIPGQGGADLTQPTTAPQQPAVISPGVIVPPNTGDAGLMQ